jgi:hypothetical protein
MWVPIQPAALTSHEHLQAGSSTSVFSFTGLSHISSESAQFTGVLKLGLDLTADMPEGMALANPMT